MERFIIKPKYYVLLFSILAIAYLYGLFVPLMDEDAGHHAAIALHMYLNHDYVNLISRGKDYLDKPHLHFWLAALSYQVFGVSTLAYKLPSFLVSILGAYSTYRLGKLLYNAERGVLAALITSSAQAAILANNDVRMDALLTGWIIFATWQLAEAAIKRRMLNYVLGALGMALAFSTKGMIGAVMPAVAIFFLLLYQRNWKSLFDWRWLAVAALWFVFISPVLYCYYLQFDLHPEKVIRGQSNISGVKFILWDQNFERLEGSNWGKGRIKPFFFFHTLLWAFLPWSFIAYLAFFKKLFRLTKNRFRQTAHSELLTVGTILIIFSIISLSRYQLPHYLNILFPFLAIISADELLRQYEKFLLGERQQLKLILGTQYVIALACLVLLAVLNIWAFPLHAPLLIILSLALLILLFYFSISRQELLKKTVFVSVLTIGLTNILLNGNFYPGILRYQSGPTFAAILHQKGISSTEALKFRKDSYSLDFYLNRFVPLVELEELKSKILDGKEYWIYTSAEGKDALEESGLAIDSLYWTPHFHISKLKAKFINPATRDSVCEKIYLIKVGKRGPIKGSSSTAQTPPFP